MDKVAIQGTRGSFHQEAAAVFFKGEEISYLECMSFPELARSVRGSDADYGVLAIENALIGTILTNYKLIQNNELFVIGEVYLPIHLNLMALPNQTKEDIKEVWSHPLAILQSENYLDQYPWEVIKKQDTATCAKTIYQKKLKGVGALASPLAGKQYRLETLDRDVQNANDTFTRFFVLASELHDSQEVNKASLSFTLLHQSGTLVHLLKRISDLGINLTKIMSVPLTHDLEHYTFYIDAEFEKHEQYESMLNQLKDEADSVNVFGVYKRGDKLSTKK